MIEGIERQDDSLLFIPFYSDPERPEYEDAVNRFAAFLEGAKEATGLRLAVVDDGSELDPRHFQDVADHFISLPTNQGKSQAVRFGLRELLQDPSTKSDFVVLYDGDGDQSYTDIPVVLDRVVDVSDGNPEIPTLVIGDRYSERLTVTPNPESIEYRQSILTFFGAIAFKLTGAEGVRDWVSGARGLTASMAEELVTRGDSSRYGLESEQLVIAGLVGARVATAPLTISRPRDPNTLRTKWLQNFEVYASHEQALREQGQDELVDLIAELVAQLTDKTEEFSIDLRPIGVDADMQFTKQDESYTAAIPWGERSKIFLTPDSFTLRK